MSELLAHITPQDLVRFGLIPELVGRMPVITTLEALSADALVAILSQPKNALLKQYQYLFELDGVTLNFTDEALHAVAEKTMALHTGARGLRSVMEGVLNTLMFNIPSDHTVETVTVTAACVNDGAAPEIVRNPEKKPVKLKATVKGRTTAPKRRNTA